MENIVKLLREINKNSSQSKKLSQHDLENIGLKDIKLRGYQLDGVNWLRSRRSRGHGCILADEMGLGKTCQSISYILSLSESVGGDFLILSPLSVVANWQNEFSRFAPGLTVVNYLGDKDARAELRADIKRKHHKPRAFLTTYETCLKDESWLSRFRWQALIVDEAHRLKNKESLLHQTLSDFDVEQSVLLTGTPVQNNLDELYSLLSFVARKIFKEKYRQDFIDKFQDVAETNDAKELHAILKPFILRRLKEDVVKDLPVKSEILLYHGMTALQKKYYKAILMKDIATFQSDDRNTNRTKLLNILMQLRKCVNHPYLFDGVEPEPFQCGEHLVEASGKLVLLDNLLRHLKQHGHRVLVFSQMTRMLDIIQDYLTYRGYSYERLDGSVRGEERYLAVKNFNQDQDTFLFLLSTKAGGVGLNLTGADTVIFVDSDFNPQNDLQAAARAHRIGQTRPVKIVRLVGRHTVEEIIMKRAEAKMRLTQSVIEDGQFSLSANSKDVASDKLNELMKFGIDSLLSDEKSSLEDVDFEAVLGATKAGEWQGVKPSSTDTQTQPEAGTQPSGSIEEEAPEGMYMFEGKDYSKPGATQDPSAADLQAFDKLLHEELASDDTTATRAAKATGGSLPVRTVRVPLTEEEKEQLRKRREELAEEKQRKAEEAKQRREQQKLQRKEALWLKHGYLSLNAALPNPEEEVKEDELVELADEAAEETGSNQIRYVIGDVTQPAVNARGEATAIVVHCVDDSGGWGRGGLFTALDRRSQTPAQHYELASQMKDLQLGDAHIIPLEDVVKSTTANTANKDTNKPGTAGDTANKDGDKPETSADTASKDTNKPGTSGEGASKDTNKPGTSGEGASKDTDEPGTSADSASKDVDKPGTSGDSDNKPGTSGQGPTVSVYVSLMITQHRDRGGKLSAIMFNHLTTALERLARAAKHMKASVHLPRIGYNTPKFNWYGTERLIRKHLASCGIPTYIYYFPRRKQHPRRRASFCDSDSDTWRKPSEPRSHTDSRRAREPASKASAHKRHDRAQDMSESNYSDTETKSRKKRRDVDSPRKVQAQSRDRGSPAPRKRQYNAMEMSESDTDDEIARASPPSKRQNTVKEETGNDARYDSDTTDYEDNEAAAASANKGKSVRKRAHEVSDEEGRIKDESVNKRNAAKGTKRKGNSGIKVAVHDMSDVEDRVKDETLDNANEGTGSKEKWERKRVHDLSDEDEATGKVTKRHRADESDTEEELANTGDADRAVAKKQETEKAGKNGTPTKLRRKRSGTHTLSDSE